MKEQGGGPHLWGEDRLEAELLQNPFRRDWGAGAAALMQEKNNPNRRGVV